MLIESHADLTADGASLGVASDLVLQEGPTIETLVNERRSVLDKFSDFDRQARSARCFTSAMCGREA